MLVLGQKPHPSEAARCPLLGGFGRSQRAQEAPTLPSQIVYWLASPGELDRIPARISKREEGNGKCYRKIGPGFRTGKNEPAATRSELKHRGSSGSGADNGDRRPSTRTHRRARGLLRLT